MQGNVVAQIKPGACANPRQLIGKWQPRGPAAGHHVLSPPAHQLALSASFWFSVSSGRVAGHAAWPAGLRVSQAGPKAAQRILCQAHMQT